LFFVAVSADFDILADILGIIFKLFRVLYRLITFDIFHFDIISLRRSSSGFWPLRRMRGCSTGCSVPHFGQTAGARVMS
jgi:hypothetical protein